MMSFQTECIPYQDNHVTLEGFAAYPSLGTDKHPAAILCHAWAGRDGFICDEARRIAEWGYVGFALDMYGKGILGKSKTENAALKAPFLADRSLLQRRLLKAFEVVAALPYVDAGRIVVLGFGFGGVCALDFARSGVDVKGVVSVYGHFEPPNLPKQPIRTRILILHGASDPVVPIQELVPFEKEMTDSHVDWQVQLFGNTQHAFMNPLVNDPASGTVYHAVSAERARCAYRNFFSEVLGVPEYA